MKPEKLHKVLARAGYGSRRHLERWIAEGRVKVNGAVAETGCRVDDQDVIEVDGKAAVLSSNVSQRVLIYHKPVGEISTRHDPQHRPTVFRSLPQLEQGRWLSVGRLDINTSGLMLFSNDGALVNALMHPSGGQTREYIVRVQGTVDGGAIQRLKSGVMLDGKPASFLGVELLADAKGANRSYRVVLGEGRYREVRRLWEAVGCRVSRLKRVRFGPVSLPRDLAPGQWRELTGEALESLRG